MVDGEGVAWYKAPVGSSRRSPDAARGNSMMRMLLTVAFLAPLATFTHQAALQRFGESAVYRPCRSFTEVFDVTRLSRPSQSARLTTSSNALT